MFSTPRVKGWEGITMRMGGERREGMEEVRRTQKDRAGLSAFIIS